MPESADQRLRRLEERLARIEARLGIGAEADDPIGRLAYRKRAAADARQGRPSPIEEIPVAELAYLTDAPPIAETAPTTAGPTEFTEVPPPLPELASVAAKNEDANVEVPPPIVAYGAVPPLPPRSADVPQGYLERTIGLKWAGWFGAAVLVVGAGLGIKFAYDEGWLGGLPDVVKLLLMSLAGFGLIAAGEVVLRRVGRFSAAGLFGAGVAVLFLVGYAGHAWYNVYAQGTAFALMGLAAVVGVLLAARADLVSIAILSLFGGHVAPIILDADSSSLVPFLSYLLFLQGLALALCYWRAAAKWWTLRSVALAGSAMWEFALAWHPDGREATLMTFAVVYAALYQAELIVTTLRTAAAVRRPADAAAGVLFSMVVTAQLVLLALLVTDGSPRLIRGGWVLGVAAACALIAVALLARRQSLGKLSVSLRIQAAALVVLAVPVLLDRENVVFGWLALAAAFAVLDARLRLRVSRVAAVGVWVMAVAALLAWAGGDDPAAYAAWLTILGTPIAGAMVVSLAATCVGHLVAVLGEKRIGSTDAAAPLTPDAGVSSALHAIAGVVWAVAALRLLPPTPATLALLLYAGLVWAASGWQALRSMAYLSAAAVLAAAIKWAVVDALPGVLAPAGTAAAAGTRPFVNEHMLLGAVIAAAMAGVGWTRRSVLLPWADAPSAALYRSALTAAVAVVLTVGSSVEVRRAIVGAGPGPWGLAAATQLGWTLLWATVAAAVLAIDRLVIRPPNPAVARVAAFVIGAVAVKHLFADAVGTRLSDGPAAVTVLFNAQVAAAVVTAAALALVTRTLPDRPARRFAAAAALLLLLVTGSLEVDRYAVFQSAAPASVVRQAGWSIWWSAFAVACVVAGFAARISTLRVAGLGLLGLTLAKVALVDLSGAGAGWRVLSFIGLGLLLLGTSVLYGKFAPALLHDSQRQTGDSRTNELGRPTANRPI